MNWLHRAVFKIRTRLSHEALYLAILLAPSPFVRIWLDRGLAVAGDGMREEICRGLPVDSVELEFAPHDEAIPQDAGW